MRQMKEIATVFETHGYTLSDIICDTMKRFKMKTLCHNSNIRKGCGFSATEILVLLLLLPLMALKSVHQLYRSEYQKQAEMQKDVLYRFKNNERYSWRRLLYEVVKMYKKLVNPEKKAAEGATALIIDDTLDKRVGYKIENISYVFDHVVKKTVLGFKTLVLGFFDGTSIVPLDFTVHAEKKLESKKSKRQYKKQVDPRSPGGKRRQEVGISKVKAAIQMIKRAAKNGFLADYVLCDSWFTCEEFVREVRKIKGGAMHLIAGIKNGNQKYGYKGGLYNAKEIMGLLKKEGSTHRNRSWGIYYYETVVSYKSIGDVKLVMCRYPRQKKWRVFITTDTKLSFVEMMKIYGIRWTVEVMFRECKQHLQFGACQSRDFDAQIASTTITFILYTLLAYLKRAESYETVGELFRQAQQGICEKNLAERLWELFEEMLAFVIQAIADNGPMDVAQFTESKEYAFIKELFESSFLFNQVKSVENAA